MQTSKIIGTQEKALSRESADVSGSSLTRDGMIVKAMGG